MRGVAIEGWSIIHMEVECFVERNFDGFTTQSCVQLLDGP